MRLSICKPTRQTIADAAQKSIDDNWLPKSKGETGNGSCALCRLFLPAPFSCNKCPMRDDSDSICCREYSLWNKAHMIAGKEKRLAAQAVVNKLECIVKEYSETKDENRS